MSISLRFSYQTIHFTSDRNPPKSGLSRKKNTGVAVASGSTELKSADGVLMVLPQFLIFCLGVFWGQSLSTNRHEVFWQHYPPKSNSPSKKTVLSFFNIVYELIKLNIGYRRVYMLFSLVLHIFKILYFKHF